MSAALSLAPSLSSTAQRIRDLEAQLASTRSALEQASQMVQALLPRNGQPIPNVVATLGLSAISAVLGTALEEA